MASRSFVPLGLVEAEGVAGAVLAYDPIGNAECPVCVRPDRLLIDKSLLSTDDVGSVVENYHLATRIPGAGLVGNRDFSRVCTQVTRHRDHHVLKVFEALNDESGFPAPEESTIKFSNWTVKALFDEYKQAKDPNLRLRCLAAMTKALTTRASIMGELAKDNKKGLETTTVSASLTPQQKRLLLEMEAQKIGLKLIEAKDS